MTVLFWGLVLFCVAFLLHLIIWKVRLPKRQTKTLLELFFGFLAISLLILWSGPETVTAWGLSAPANLLEYIHISLFFISCTLAYIDFYSALEADSPSIVMVMNIARTGSEGLDEEHFVQSMTDEILVKPRVRDLLVAKIASMDGDKYRLTPKGVLLARIFIFYRKLLRTSRLGG